MYIIDIFIHVDNNIPIDMTMNSTWQAMKARN